MKKDRIVTFPEYLYQRIVNRCFRNFPEETGGFLLSSQEDNDKEIYRVEDVYHSRASFGDRESWTFTHGCVIRANRAASRKGLIVVGMYHSHPWTIIPPGLVYLNHIDAEAQENCGFRLSMIVGITNDRFLTSVWRLGYAAPYHQTIFLPGEDQSTHIEKLLQNHKDDKFWSKHFGLLPKEDKLGH